jgi:hypothetical protein
MAIFQTQTTSFKQELLEGVHNFLVDTFNIALYTDSANLGANVTVYSSAGEISGGGYVAGGQALTGVTVANLNGVAYVNFADVVWSPASFTAAGALIYNASKSDRSVAVLSFGANKIATGSFTIQMPPNTSDAALLRFA